MTAFIGEGDLNIRNDKPTQCTCAWMNAPWPHFHDGQPRLEDVLADSLDCACRLKAGRDISSRADVWPLAWWRWSQQLNLTRLSRGHLNRLQLEGVVVFVDQSSAPHRRPEGWQCPGSLHRTLAICHSTSQACTEQAKACPLPVVQSPPAIEANTAAHFEMIENASSECIDLSPR